MLILRNLFFALFLPAIFISAQAEVTVTLEGFLVTTDSSGRLQYRTAQATKPGDILEYRALYHNISRLEISNLTATLPIPIGTTYIANSAFPKGFEASLDGNTYAIPPLRRQVIQNGRLVEELVPFSEYRFLRWTFPSFAGRQKVTVGAQAQVNQ